MDEMQMPLKIKYQKQTVSKKSFQRFRNNMIPVQIDFPLPQIVQNMDKRINEKGSFQLQQKYLYKNQAHYLAGKNIRLSYLFQQSEKFIDQIVNVCGWVSKFKKYKQKLFIDLLDGSNAVPLQIVIQKNIRNQQRWQQLQQIKKGYSLILTGKIIQPQNKIKNIYLILKGEQFQKIKIVGKCDDQQYPLASNYFHLQAIRDIVHLRPRTQYIGAITRVKNNLAYATHQFFQNNGYLYIHTPIITTVDSQCTNEKFQVTTILPKSKQIKDIPQIDGKIDYKFKNSKQPKKSKQFKQYRQQKQQQLFKKPTFLTDSGGLAVQNYCCSLGNVYTFSPVFRVQWGINNRSLSQFWMVEPQLAFADIYDIMECAQSYIKFCISYVLKNNKQDLLLLDKKKPGHIDYLKKIVNQNFAKISYTQAIQILSKVKQKGFRFQNYFQWGMALSNEHLKYLCDHVYRKPMIIFNYPKEIKPFYMRLNDDQKTVASFDIVVSQILEIAGGSQKQQRIQYLEKRIEAQKLSKQDYWWYLDLRKYGTIPHGGFGAGLQRLTMMITGVQSIRDISSFPRTPGNVEF